MSAGGGLPIVIKVFLELKGFRTSRDVLEGYSSFTYEEFHKFSPGHRR